MANVKISELPATTTLTDSDLVAVVNNGTTKQVTAVNLKTYVAPALTENGSPVTSGEISQNISILGLSLILA
jgi:hypothetical protein